jgi:hypothetical protein
MKVPPRLVPNTQASDSLFKEQRQVPRFPLPKEQVKIFMDNDYAKVCAIRDMSETGLGISLLEPGEVLLFPLGQEYNAELKLGEDTFRITLVVRRVSAWSVGLEFLHDNVDLALKIGQFLNPMVIGKSLKKVALQLNPDVADFGLSSWYHGAAGTDLYFWSDARGGVDRVLLCFGDHFWEWSLENNQRTGSFEREDGSRANFSFDLNLSAEMRALAFKILEHGEVLDYRLVSFLKDQVKA